MSAADKVPDMTAKVPDIAAARAGLPAGGVAAILPAAGKSRRFGGPEKKIFLRLAGRPVWYHAAAALRRRREVGPLVLAVDREDMPRWESEFGELLSELDATLVPGGAERVESVRNALAAVPSAEWIAVHDAARPLVTDGDLERVFAAAAESEAALLASRLRGTVKRQRWSGEQAATVTVDRTVDRSTLWEALTPQVFRGTLIREAYARWRGFPVTDDAQLVERCGHDVRLVEGLATNLKITVAADLRVARALLASESDAI